MTTGLQLLLMLAGLGADTLSGLASAQSCAVPASTLSFDCGTSCTAGSACMLKTADTCGLECFARSSDTRFTFLIPFGPTPIGAAATASKSNDALTKIAKWTLPVITTEVVVRGGSSLTGSTHGNVAKVQIADDFVAGNSQLTLLNIDNIDLSANYAKLVLNFPTGLTEIKLQNAMIPTFPLDPNRYKSLTLVELSDNDISQVNQTHAMDTLEKLHLDVNRISAFTALYPRVSYLDLAYNELTAVPPVLTQYTQLKYLHLSGNPIKTFAIEFALSTLVTLGLFQTGLAEFDVYLPNLVDLYLDLNNFKDFPPIIFSHSKLKTLTIDGSDRMKNVTFTNVQANFLATLDQLTMGESSLSSSCASSQQATVQGYTVCITGGAVDLSVINGPRVVVTDPSAGSKTANTTNASSTPGSLTPDTSTNSTSPSSPSSDGTNQQANSSSVSTAMTVVIIAAVGVFLVTLFIGFVVCKRGRSGPKRATDASNSNASNSKDYENAEDDGGNRATSVAYSKSNTTSKSGNASTSSGGFAYLSLWNDPDMLAAKVDANEVVDIHKIGQGGFCDVWLVLYRQTQQLASKRLREPTHERTQDFVKEIKLVSKLQHAHIVELVGAAWTKEADLQALFEFMDNGDLRSHLVDASTTRAWSLHKVQITLHIVEALVYVHSFNPPLVHRDLKSRNVLLNANMVAKLTDFGIARYQSDHNTMTAGVGTSRWLAPEVISGSTNYGPLADMYALGVVISELDTHQIPYEDVRMSDGSKLSDVGLMQLVATGKLRPTLLPTCPPEMAAVASQCLSLEPAERPSATEVAYALRTYIKSVGGFIV